MYKIIITFLFFFSLITKVYCQDDSVSIDTRDGREYKTIKIGEQVWLSENLKYFSDGAIPYENKKENITQYGYLYDWETANKVCPKGWHLPVESEWKLLITKLGGKNIAGGKMKLADDKMWKSPNKMGSVQCGFSALPSGALIDGVFQLLREGACFWSSEAECTSAYAYFLTFNAVFLDKRTLTKTDKVSLRCIKD